MLEMVCLLWIWRGWMDAEVEGLEGFSIAIRGRGRLSVGIEIFAVAMGVRGVGVMRA